MARKVKCKICGKWLTNDVAYKVAINGKNQYYCTKEEYEHMKKELLTSNLIHCDETTFTVVKKGRGPNSKDYMWVYHTCEKYDCPPIYLYAYDDGKRDTETLKKFLGDYSGIVMTDGYQVYHTAAKERPDHLTVAGCWVHAKRKYAEYVKGVGTEGFRGSIAEEGVKRIQAIYHI